MITRIKIQGFKSFHNFEMEFTPFTVVAGINASGKSNLFDALKLLGRLAESDNLKKAFTEQRGEFSELFTQISQGKFVDEMGFELEMLVNKTVKDAWGNTTELKYTRLRYELKIKRYTNETGIEDLAVVHERLEKLKHMEDNWIKKIPRNNLEHWRPKVKTGKRSIPYMMTKEENGIPTVIVPQDGTTGNKRRFPLKNANRTVLSSFDAVDFPHVLAAKEEMKSWKFLQLNPEELRKPTSKKTGESKITTSGGNLAGTLHRIKQEDALSLQEISRKLNSFLPNFIEVNIYDDVENKQYLIKLKDNEQKEYSSRVLSEGTLRILALCVLEQDSKHTGLLCFEEPENGIHPFRISTMAALLKDLSTDFEYAEEMPLKQIIVNTHSPTLVGNLQKWQKDINVSIWFSQMRRAINKIEGEKTKIALTKLIPVEKTGQLTLEYSTQEKKLSLDMVQRYLQKDYT